MIVLGIVLHPVCFSIKTKTELERHGDELVDVNPTAGVKKDGRYSGEEG